MRYVWFSLGGGSEAVEGVPGDDMTAVEAHWGVGVVALHPQDGAREDGVELARWAQVYVELGGKRCKKNSKWKKIENILHSL